MLGTLQSGASVSDNTRSQALFLVSHHTSRAENSSRCRRPLPRHSALSLGSWQFALMIPRFQEDIFFCQPQITFQIDFYEKCYQWNEVNRVTGVSRTQASSQHQFHYWVNMTCGTRGYSAKVFMN